jgi:2-oxo-4-hydroxy-4-carboxy--5-ureidoimidazoline (OHCU) decarboxylase
VVPVSVGVKIVNFSKKVTPALFLRMAVTLAQFNDLSGSDKVQHIHSIFEKSPWVVERALNGEDKNWESFSQLMQHLTLTLDAAREEEKLSLLVAHPDLVGKAALEGRNLPQAPLNARQTYSL